MTAFGASAKMQPPSALGQAFDATCAAWLGRGIDTVPLRLHRRLCPLQVPRRSAISDARFALPNLYNVAVGIANVAARLAVFVLWLCDKLGSSTSP